MRCCVAGRRSSSTHEGTRLFRLGSTGGPRRPGAEAPARGGCRPRRGGGDLRFRAGRVRLALAAAHTPPRHGPRVLRRDPGGRRGRLGLSPRRPGGGELRDLLRALPRVPRRAVSPLPRARGLRDEAPGRLRRALRGARRHPPPAAGEGLPRRGRAGGAAGQRRPRPLARGPAPSGDRARDRGGDHRAHGPSGGEGDGRLPTGLRRHERAPPGGGPCARRRAGFQPRAGGEVVWIGLHEDATELSGFDVVLGERRISGSYAVTPRDLQAAIGLFAHGKIEVAPWVRPFPLAEGARVFRQLVTAPPEEYIKALLLP